MITMNKRPIQTIVLLFTLSLLAATSFAQISRKCKSNELREHHFRNHPEDYAKVQSIETFTENWIATHSTQKTNAVVTIPVVVHVVYRNATQNISDAQIQSQITVLNDDFRRQNSDASNTPSPFVGVAADTEIEFCLASNDPNGNPTNGITRTQTSVSEIGQSAASNGGYAKVYYDMEGGKDAWDEDSYLNIWVCEIAANGTFLGYASPPGNADPGEDGCVIDYKFFGTIGTAANSQPNHLGRTVTHEVGHYFNLEHVWGQYGGCNDDDGVADTPNQDVDSYGCPGLGPSSSSCGSQDMFSNYMDYSDDPCMNLFTLGQKARMLAAINGPRASLLSSNGCSQISAVDPSTDVFGSVRVYPNPTNGVVFVDGLPQYRQNITASVIDIQGRLIQKQTLLNMERQEINMSKCSSGLYFVEVRSGDDRAVKKIVVAK